MGGSEQWKPSLTQELLNVFDYGASVSDPFISVTNPAWTACREAWFQEFKNEFRGKAAMEVAVCGGWGSQEARRDQRQALTFKTMPLVTNCFQLGSASRTFSSLLTVSSSCNSVYGLMHSWRRSSQSSVASQWLSLPIRKQVFNMWAFVEDASDENLSRIFASPKLFFNIPSVGNPGQTFFNIPSVGNPGQTFCCSSIGILHGHFFASTGQILPRQQDK